MLPVTTMAEENGTYVNRDRRVQRYQQARSQPGMARPAWWVAGEVLAGPGPSADAPATAAEAFVLLGDRWPVFAGLTHADLGFTGRVLGRESARARERAERRCPVTPELKGFILSERRQDGPRLHRHHGRRGAADADGAEGQRLDAEPPRSQPGRLGGLLQPAADGVKNILKEETYPALANRWLFLLAPRSRSFRRCCCRR